MSDRLDAGSDGITRIPDPLGTGHRPAAVRPPRPARSAGEPRRRSGWFWLLFAALLVLVLIWPATIFVGRTGDVVDQCRRDSSADGTFRERSGDFVRCLFTT